LKNTAPASTPASNRAASASSRVHTLAPSPYGVAFASRSASSASAARSTAATGPNVSSAAAGMSGVTSASTVGG
jgi:hypothetical protein